MRTLFSVFVGYAIFVVSAILLFRIIGQEPHAQASTAFMVGSTLYGMFFAAVGGYVATVIARGVSPMPAIALCLLIAVLGGLALAMRPESTTRWSQIATVLFMAPMALVGGLVRLRRVAH
jgi:RsiW-degrading membrane proteinase PrsW (M82 family)